MCPRLHRICRCWNLKKSLFFTDFTNIAIILQCFNNCFNMDLSIYVKIWDQGRFVCLRIATMSLFQCFYSFKIKVFLILILYTFDILFCFASQSWYLIIILYQSVRLIKTNANAYVFFGLSTAAWLWEQQIVSHPWFPSTKVHVPAQLISLHLVQFSLQVLIF